MNNSLCDRRCIMNKISLLLKMNKPIYFSFYHKPRKQPLHKNYISRQITPFYKQARNLWGYGLSHPPPLKICHSQGKNSSSIYLCRATYWTQDHVINNCYTNRAKIKHCGQPAYYGSHFCRAKLLTLPTYIEVMSLSASPEDS